MRKSFGLKLSGLFALIVVLAVPANANAGHWLLDHPSVPATPPAIPATTFNSGGEGAEWELIDTVTTGSPHTDLDFFTQGADTYASVGTLAISGNGGGQTIVRLTENGEVAPSLLSMHPSASCVSNPEAALGLQHDAEAAPKGNALLNAENPYAVRTDTQLIIDATDAGGRCHDQGVLGLQQAPQGGLEFVDVTDIANPVEIGLTSHIGEAHTVNVDPKRPHIAYASTSDSINVNADGERQNEVADSSDAYDLDGFEVVDFSSCMNFPAGTTVEQKREGCRPQVFRYRFPSSAAALGHTVKTGGSAVFGCHELEVYPDDKLTCGSGNALIELDMSGAFDDMGTPTDFSDDRPRGTPLPCRERESSTVGPFGTGAQVTDCVDGAGDGLDNLTVPSWIASGAPSLEGVEYVGSIHHQGGGPGGGNNIPPFDSTQDLAFNHEAELSASGKSLIATDERGGGVLPPGASCAPGVDNTDGNGGVHFYRADALVAGGPGTAAEEQQAYALTSEGEKAIFRAPIRTQARATVCTAHVFHQIPGENRIFMAWYSQGTQVIDFVENPDGTVDFKQAGWFTPENANQWSSAIFKTETNPDGSETYYGASGDFALGEAGRNSIDVYKVTLPPAPQAAGPGGGGGGGGGGGAAGGACAQALGGTKAADDLLGSIAGDRIKGRGGDDTIDGRDGDDCVNGGGGADRLKGSAGADKLVGGRGRDRLNGGPDADVLRTARGGRDRVTCGKGKDKAIVDARDKTRGCERVKVRGSRK